MDTTAPAPQGQPGSPTPHGLPGTPAARTAGAFAGRYDVVSRTVAIPVGSRTMNAYVAAPAGPHAPARRPAVVVGFEMFGLTGYIRRTADRLAARGFLAIVPDFHHRTAPGFSGVADEAGRAQGYALLNRLDRAEVREDVQAVQAYLERRPDTTGRSGMVGFSLGGHLAFFAATQLPLAAVAVVYPGWLDTTGTALGTPGPLLDLVPGMAGRTGRLLYLAGADDHVVTAGQHRATGEALAAAGVPHEIVVYPDTPHGFLADERDTYRQDRAADAWRRIDALLAAELLDAEPAEPDGTATAVEPTATAGTGHRARSGEAPAPSVRDDGDAPTSGPAGTAG